MTSPRENLLRTLRRQGFDTVPVDLGLCPAQVEAFKRRFGHEDYQAYFKVPHRFVGIELEATYAEPRALYPRETPPANTEFDVWGIGHSRQEGCYHMTHMHHPLAGDPTLEEVRRYPLPAFKAGAADLLRRAIADLHARQLAAVGGMACTIWETAWYLRSMEDLMADMLAADERAQAHFDRIADFACRRSVLFAEAGADIIHIGDDIGMQSTIMMSVPLWAQWIKPRLARVIAAARAVKPDILFFYHSCGHILPFVPHLIEVGVDVLNPIQPESMKFEEVHRLAAGRLSYWGTIGTQTTLPFGTPQDVKETVWSRLRLCGPQGGIVIAPTHVVEPEVPWENLVAMAEAAAEFAA
jgi:uroporphyrinogen decarboxylase